MKILHILRAPIGGLFRHVRDLSIEQIKLGHDVGLVTATPPDHDYVKKLFAEISSKLTLGAHHFEISRLPSFQDYKNVTAIKDIIVSNDVNVIHGHGAKGGAYARLLKKQLSSIPLKTFYTMHGGTLHYKATSPIGFVFLKLEKYLQKFTDGYIFESQTSKTIFEQKIGKLAKANKVIHNGLHEHEFVKVSPNKDAADFLYIGELRHLKGVDILINAFSKLVHNNPLDRPLNLVIVGYGPEEEYFKTMVAKAGIYDHVTFVGPMPAAEAFKLANVQVMPSRAEGLPYIILETIAAKMPLIASNVGGIPEIYGDNTSLLFESENVDQLHQYMAATLSKQSNHVKKVDILHKFVKNNFHVKLMSQQITDFYVE